MSVSQIGYKSIAMKENQYTVSDFVMDEYFQSWVLDPGDEKDHYWLTWLKENPGYDETIEEARRTVLLLGFTKDTEANQDLVDVWKKVRDSAALSVSAPGEPVRRPQVYWKVAAAFIGVLMLAAGYLFYRTQADTLHYSSAYGEITHVVLPDGSGVTLNGNTKIQWNRSWQSPGTREVFLEGEAFFEVEHLESNGKPVKFKVRTGELDVEVLGTTFNVNSRHEETRVVLNSGKVRLNIQQQDDTAKLIMAPGDMVTFNKTEGRTNIDHIDHPDQLSEWKDNKLIFRDTPLAEIGRILEDTYGLEVEFSSDSLKQRRFRGTFHTSDIEVLREVLTQTYNIRIVKK